MRTDNQGARLRTGRELSPPPEPESFYDPISQSIAKHYAEPVSVYYSQSFAITEPESHGDSIAFSFSFTLGGAKSEP